MFTMYVCSIVRSIISLHSLIDNKLDNKEREISIQKKDIEKTLEKISEKYKEDGEKKKQDGVVEKKKDDDKSSK